MSISSSVASTIEIQDWDDVDTLHAEGLVIPDGSFDELSFLNAGGQHRGLYSA